MNFETILFAAAFSILALISIPEPNEEATEALQTAAAIELAPDVDTAIIAADDAEVADRTPISGAGAIDIAALD